jgi:hemolysin activation/secretion protein
MGPISFLSWELAAVSMKILNSLAAVALSFLVFGWASMASAAPPPTPSQPYQPLPGTEGGSILKGIEQQLPPIEAPLPIPKAPQAPQETQKPAAEEVKVTVTAFEFSGNTLITTDDLRARVAEFVGKTMSLSELQQVADAVAAFYQTRGYLANVTLPPQKIDDGVVKIQIIEGRLGDVKVNMPEGSSRFGVNRAREWVMDNNPQREILRMRQVERAIYLLNETPGVAVTTQVEPGAKDGEVNLNLGLADTPLFHARVEANNQSSRATGIYQGLANLYLDNPLGFGDQLGVSGTYSQGSKYARAEYSAPLTNDGLRLSGYVSELNYKNVGDFAFPANPNAGYGYAKTQGLNLGYAWMRSMETNLNASLALDRREYVNRMVSTDFYTSQYALNDLSLGVSGNHYDDVWGGGVTNFSVTTTMGRMYMGGDNPANYGLYTPKSYKKTLVALSRDQQLIPGSLSLLSSFSGQIASADLDSSEKFYLGGPGGVRAYPLSQGGGAQGMVWTNELQQKLPWNLTASAFLDAGWIQQYRSLATYAQMKGKTNATDIYQLYGTGVGLSYVGYGFNVSASVARSLGQNPLFNSYGQSLNNDNRSPSVYAWFKVAYQF